MAALTTIAALASVAEAGYSAYKTAHQPKASAPALPVVSPAPAPDPAQSSAAAAAFRPRRSTTPARAPSDLTGPQGLAAAPTASTTLLGL